MVHKWESRVAAIKRRYQEDRNDQIRLAILMGMLSQECQDMIMQTSVLKEEKMKYESVRDYFLNLSTQRMQMWRPTPMDIGGLEGKKTGTGEKREQEEGYGGEEEWDLDAVSQNVKCYACQGSGRDARDCARDKKKIGEQGKAKGKGEWQYQGKGGGKKGGGKKGGGKGKGSGVVCWNCNKT